MEEIIIDQQFTPRTALPYLQANYSKDISEEDQVFIKDHLNLNNKGTVEIEGWLTLPILQLWFFSFIGVLVCIAAVFGRVEGFDFQTFVTLIVVMPILYMTLRGSILRKTYVKYIFIGFQVNNLLQDFLNLSDLTFFDLAWHLLWLAYFIRSKRVKYTFIH